MHIRVAVEADCAAIKTCARSAYEKYTERIGREPAPMVADFVMYIRAGNVLVVENKGVLVAYAVYYADGDCLQLENIAVDPAHHGRGYGTQLLKAIHDLARQGKYCAVSLYTNEKMVENLLWYPKRGYKEIDRRKEDGFSRVFFRYTV